MNIFIKNFFYHKKKNLKNYIFLIFLFISFFNFAICDYCPRDKPILKDNECVSEYCPYADLEDNVCIISNPFIKVQWLNNIHVFSLDPISGVTATSNSKGDLFLMSQGYSEENSGLKYIYGFYKDGNGLFYDNNFKYHYSFESINFPEYKTPDIFHSVHIEEKEYLLSTQSKNEMFLIDFNNKNYTIFTLNTNTYNSYDLFRLKGYYDDETIEDEDERVYFIDYINCLDQESYTGCYLGLRIFRFTLTDMEIVKEVNNNIEIKPLSDLHCFQNDNLYIQCIYTTFEKEESKYNYVVSLFNYKTLKEEYRTILEEDINIENTFDSSIQLNGNIFVAGISYPYNRNIIKLFLKKMVMEKKDNDIKFYLENHLSTIEAIHLNEDNQYIIEKGLAKRNSMVKISQTKFAILLNEFSDTRFDTSWNKKLLILILNIFNESRLSIRYYKINFELYNLLIYEDIRGYNLNNFFGVLLESVINTDSYNPKAIFLTFGYINSTYEDEIDKNLKQNDTNSIIVLDDYITSIENNLFGYKFIGVKILKLPDINKSGYFINNQTEEKIKEGDIVSIDTVLRFILTRKINVEDEFSINFAGVAQEPEYDEMNLNAEKVEIYPINNTDAEENFYNPKQLIGRVVHYLFEIRCYDSCNGCTKLSNDPNKQYCIQCKKGYIFKEETNNCIQDIKCYENCETCSGPPINSQNMNCLTCKEGYKYYEETNNCLNCPKFVSYDLTQCIDEVPEGYYLEDEEQGLLGKCHEYCKSCDDAPGLWGLNCLECKYNSTRFRPKGEGDCPPEDYDEGEEEDDEMPGGECPRNKPILIENRFCSMTYCTPDDYEDQTCVLNNYIIKEQWMNNIQTFGEGNIIYVSVSYGFEGELYLFGQKRDVFNNNFENYIYAIDANGSPLILDEDKNEFHSFQTVKFPNDIYLEGVRFVKNFQNNKTFLLSTQIETEMYAINFEEKSTEIFKFDQASYSSDNIFIFKNNSEYFTNFIYCQNNYNLSNCSMVLRKFKFNSKNQIEVIAESKPDEKINSETNFICIESYDNFILCVYTSVKDGFNMHKLGLFDYTNLELKYDFDIEASFETEAFFDSMIQLNGSAFVMAYSTERSVIRVFVKYIKYDYSILSPVINDYIENVPEININENDYFYLQDAIADRNSLCKINDNKFAMLINNFNDLPNDVNENPSILIYIFNIFNDNKNINVRRYSINFKLYNMFNYGKILGYKLGQFFGIILESSSPEDRSIIKSSFMTFGYVNTTEPSILIDPNFIKENSLYSKYIRFSDYIKKIENNLFGYEFIGVTIIVLPDITVGHFIKDVNDEINTNDILDIKTEIRLKLNPNHPAGFSAIVFAGAVREAEYEYMNEFAEEILTYPINSTVNESDFYKPEILIGKQFLYGFDINEEDGKGAIDDECYPSCVTCYSPSTDKDNHLCKICKPEYYFKEDTYNCYKEINEHYYFNEEEEIFSPCYPDCLTCSEKEISSTQMNCLSCEEDYNYYYKSQNCLKCPNYVNYMQTECIDKIPEGYYLLDENLGTIEKCHELCKTCNAGPFTDDDDNFHMNCITCLYEQKDFIPDLSGDCPKSNVEPIPDDEPVDGQCPREKPILKQNKCQNIYCTEKEFKDGTCKIYNKYIDKQWLNNFHIFDDSLSSYVGYDINDKGEIFFMAQREDDKTFKKYLYGFNQNGKGILYDKTKKDYTSFKIFSSQFSGYTDKVKYIEINQEGYLLNMLKDKTIYLINYNTDEVISQSINYSPFSLDTMIKLKGKNNIYLFDYIYCLDESVFDKCYLGFTNYKIENKNKFTLEKTSSNSQEDLIKVGYNTKLTCFENNFNIIQCTYSIKNDEKLSTSQYILGLFNPDTLKLFKTFIIEEKLFDNPIFDSMIQLKDNACIIAYYNPNIIKVIFKELTQEDDDYILEDYLEEIKEIKINDDRAYNLIQGNSFRNSLYKLNDDEFVMLLNDYGDDTSISTLNTGMIIITFRIYNDKRNVIVRHYKIEFNLYNMFIDGDLMGYKFNEFFGVLVELTSPNLKFLSRAAFLTFGYVNTTDDVSAEVGTKNLIINEKKIKVKEYIKGIENNLFGYELEGVKILSLPDENKIGYFKDSGNKKIKVNDIIDINSELSFVKNSDPTPGEYSLSFAGVVKEPLFEVQNNFANKVINYPNNALPENYFNQQKSFVGKEFKYSFTISKKKEEEEKPKCFKNCETCYYSSDNIDDQYCLKCKVGFYFIEGTHNCYDKIETKYYFNEKTNTFSPCHKNCLTCNGKEIDELHMNCKACNNSYNFYEKSSNCLNCLTFVNFDQTECMPRIPEGYYLLNKKLGTVGKCHNLCKTCITGPIEENNKLYMNCKTCLYENNNIELPQGNCPETPGSSGNNSTNEIKKKQNGSNLVIWISVIFGILIMIIILVIVCKKCSNSNKSGDSKTNTDYYNIGGQKNIPFEDENNSGIN